jgi:hypothetical protein
VDHNREWNQQQMLGLIVDHSFLPDPNTDDFTLATRSRNGAQTRMFVREFERRRITVLQSRLPLSRRTSVVTSKHRALFPPHILPVFTQYSNLTCPTDPSISSTTVGVEDADEWRERGPLGLMIASLWRNTCPEWEGFKNDDGVGRTSSFGPPHSNSNSRFPI